MIGRVKEITLHEARPFIEAWHYSKKCPTGLNIFYGWFIEEELYAVADYGIGVNGYQSTFLARITGCSVTEKNLVELKRLCRLEPKNPAAYLTSFLGICHRLLAKRGYSFVVSFSDPDEGHSGGIYRAANFRDLGKTNAEWHLIDTAGRKHHRRFAGRYAERHGVSIAEARQALGVKRVRVSPKNRWFLALRP